MSLRHLAIALSVLISTAFATSSDPDSAELVGSGSASVLRASAVVGVLPGPRNRPGRVVFPIPCKYRSQIPLSFELDVTPREALKSARWIERDDGLDWACEVIVDPDPTGAVVRWSENVLVFEREPIALPRTSSPEVPDSAKEWVRGTAAVPSADAGVAAISRALEASDDGRADDLGDYVERVVHFVAQGGWRPEQDAESPSARRALAAGRSSTTRANLCAALLRARGIPARTVANLPTWTDQLFEHWLVEYWHPNVGWVAIDPSLDRIQPSPTTFVVLDVASAVDEDSAFADVNARNALCPGAADTSVPRVDDELALGSHLAPKTFERRMNFAEVEVQLALDAEQVAALADRARANWKQLSEAAREGRFERDRTRRIDRAIAGEDARALIDALAPKR